MYDVYLSDHVEDRRQSTELPLASSKPLLVSHKHTALVSRSELIERALSNQDGNTSVKVALRARPLVPRERLEGAKACVTVDEDTGGVLLGSQRQFLFDHAFGPYSAQDEIYDTCVSGLVDAVVEGYNATVLAYGPTGSGKTFTMGTGSALHCMPEQQGIIPRVIRHLFEVIRQSSNNRSFIVRAQFLEIYNEELRDLLALPGCQTTSAGGALPFCSGNGSSAGACSNRIDISSVGGFGLVGGQRGCAAIRECPDGQIIVTGAREEVVTSYEDLVQLLDRGALARATGTTALNEQSSRSHAIFTIIVEQSIQANSSKQEVHSQPQHSSCRQSSNSNADGSQLPGTDSSSGSPLTPRARLLQQLNQSVTANTHDAAAEASVTHNTSHASSSVTSSRDDEPGDVWGSVGGSATSLQVEYRCAKFHLVDLAGSERTKRSGAVGARFKETVTINQGLLALGNVISALGDDKRRVPGRHVPYRDSKLTRLLQDSLGGNSKTLMIACVSSADSVLEENLNTLKYASRARHIRNRPVVNRQRLGSDNGGIAGDVQALQLLLLRRFATQVLGTLTGSSVPELLLVDVGHCDEATSLRLLHELQALAAFPTAFATGLMPDIKLQDQGLQQQNQQHDSLQQQLADLEAQLTMAQMQAAAFEVQLEGAEDGKAASDQTAAAAVEQQETAKHQLVRELDQLHADGKIGSMVRNQVYALVLKLLKPLDRLQLATGFDGAAAQQACRSSVQSHPLPALDMSCCDEATADTIPAAVKVVKTSSQEGISDQQHVVALQQELRELKQQLTDTTAQLQSAQHDLLRDEDIFAQRVMEIAKLRDQMAAAEALAQKERVAAAQQIQHLQTDLSRWRVRAIAVQGCAAVDTTAAGASKASTTATATPSSAPNQSPILPDSLVGELSFAASTSQQQQTPASECAEQLSPGAGNNMPGQSAAGNPTNRAIQTAAANNTDQHALPTRLMTNDALGLFHDAGQQGYDVLVHNNDDEDDQVLFDDELASYISDTDYTDLMAEDSGQLLAELQAVLADKVALEEEKSAALAEAAAAQQGFERSQALLQGQLSQLSAAISSQEMLISTLQSNEAEAREMGAVYLERCRELEAELAELQLDLEELTAALARVEADAAASVEEKQQLRAEYEGKIQAVVEQMSGLQRQLKGQDVSRVDRERQRAAQQVQQLQAHLTGMRTEQDALRRRLQERLLSQEKAAAERSKEMAALRRAADAAKKRVAEMEGQARRQQAELRAKAAEAAAIRKQLKQLEAKASLACSRQGISPSAMTRSRAPSQSPRASLKCSCSSSTKALEALVQQRSSRRTVASRKLPNASLTAGSGASPITGTEGHISADLSSMALPVSCAGGPSRSATDHRQHHVWTWNGSNQQIIDTADNSLNSSTVSLSTTRMSTWLRSQLQLLALKRAAEEQLQHLQARHSVAVSQHEQLLATKACLDIKQLRKAASGASNTNITGKAKDCESALSHGEHCPLEGLTDQLDASDAELDHVQHQIQEQQERVAAADEAVTQLRAQVPHMSAKELSLLLHQTLDVVVEQGSAQEAATSKVNKMELELAESQQQVEEMSSCLQSTQLQHQTQVAELQRHHEQRVMQLFKQSTTAVQEESSGKHQTIRSPTPSVSTTVKSKLGGHASAAAALLTDSHLRNMKPPQQPNTKSIAATVAAVFRGAVVSIAVQQSVCSSMSGAGQVAGIVGIPASHSCCSFLQTVGATAAARPAAHSTRELTPQPAAGCITTRTGGGCSSLPQDDTLLSSDRCPLPTNPGAWRQTDVASNQQRQKAVTPPGCQAADAVLRVEEPAQHRLSPRQGSPTRGPQLSDVMACLAGKLPSQQQPSSCQRGQRQLQVAGHLLSGRQQQKANGTEAASQQQLQQVHLLSSSGSSSPGADPKVVAGSDLSPSKLQARLAAYRSHLKQASPQKEHSASVSSQAAEGHAAHVAASTTAGSAGCKPASTGISAQVRVASTGEASLPLPGLKLLARLTEREARDSSSPGATSGITSGSSGITRQPGQLRPLPGYQALTASPRQQKGVVSQRQ